MRGAEPWKQSLVLVAWVLVTGTSASAQSLSPPCETGTRYIQLRMEPSAQEPVLCISPDESTTLLFHDAELLPESLSVEGAERFKLVDMGRTIIRLEPSERMVPGERLRLTVRFRDGAAPVSAFFWLVVRPGQAEPWVEVYRHKRTIESFQQELAEKNTQLRRCQEDHARVRAEGQSPGGLTGLLAMELMGETGVVARNLVNGLDWRPLKATRVGNAKSYRAATRVAVLLTLMSPKAGSLWRIGRVELVGPDHRSRRLATPWQGEAVGPEGPMRRLVIEAEAAEAETPGEFTLKIWSEDGTESITFTGITFP
ncbi:DUF2381 family protein [Hyalangium versicolor]|uniref:DUF2381 family protein n=1 Tax=Hyalangium versicolor TaxID=2861190 RepID=UPI001CCBA95C|nr:DUF2381 family protein [Hyalangium versicolor]